MAATETLPSSLISVLCLVGVVARLSDYIKKQDSKDYDCTSLAVIEFSNYNHSPAKCTFPVHICIDVSLCSDFVFKAAPNSFCQRINTPPDDVRYCFFMWP